MSLQSIDQSTGVSLALDRLTDMSSSRLAIDSFDKSDWVTVGYLKFIHILVTAGSQDPINQSKSNGKYRCRKGLLFHSFTYS